jgi:tol-pal system protein YbgF
MKHYPSIVSSQKGAGFKPAPFFIIPCLLGALLATAQVMAEIPVVDIEDREAVTPVKAATYPVSGATSSVTVSASPGASRQGQLSEIFVQMQQLQHEVQELRGLVEQQNFDIQTLKQQGKDNYIDLDKRISALQSNASSGGSATTTEALSNTGAEAMPATGAEKDSYDAAYKQLDLGHKDDAIAAFQKHVALYPNGKYAPNAYYWMGQIYLSQSQLEPAREQFVTLLKNFPDDRKAPDAKFALGKVYFQQGKKAEAKKLILDVSQGDSRTAALAKTFLQDNF